MTRPIAFLLASALTLAHGIAAAQPATGPAGHWEGSIEVPGQPLAIVVDLAPKEAQPWVGTIAIPAQNLKAFPLSDISVTGNAVAFAMKGVPGDPRFAGTLSADGKSISGEFTQGGGSIPFTLAWKGEAKIEEPPNSTEITKDLEGSWEGALDVSGTVLRLVLKLTNQPGGAMGTLVSLDQAGAEIPISSIAQAGSQLKFTITTINASYVGDLKDGQLAGTWAQGPGSWPLVFKRPVK
jgi:hypothetical protein